jgi:hypothetical protein
MMPRDGEATSSLTVTEHPPLPPVPPVPPISDRGRDDDDGVKYFDDITEEQRALVREQRERLLDELSKNKPAASTKLPSPDLRTSEREPDNLSQKFSEQMKRDEEPARRRFESLIMGAPLEDEQWGRVRDYMREERTKYETTIKLQALKIEKLEKLEQELISLHSKVRREEYEREQQAKKREKAKARGPKPLNRVVFDVKATISPDAQGTYEAFKKRYHPPQRMYPTRVGIDGQNLWMWVEYTVKGGHPADIRRALRKCVADAGAALVGEPSIEVIERTSLENDQG